MTELSRAGEVALLHEDGIAYRDCNRNGSLDPFEDPRRPVDERVADLLSQMTLEEKAGMMFHQGLGVGRGRRADRGARPVRGRDDVGSRLRSPHDPLQRLLDARAPAARRVAQPAAAPRRADAARDPGHRLLRPASRLQRQPGDELGRRAFLAVARAARARRDP